MADGLPSRVSDVRSNKNEQILHAVEVLGRSTARRAVFEAIYYHKKSTKTVAEIADRTGLSRMRVLQEGRKLAVAEVVGQTKKDGDTAYVQEPFYQTNKKKILKLVDSPQKQAAYPTKRSKSATRSGPGTTRTRRRGAAKFLTIDDVDSFDAVRGVAPLSGHPLPEETFKHGLQQILGEEGEFKDWGGEDNDLFSTRLQIAGKRLQVAIALKGPAHKGKLKPSGMGKNADQIQRLFRSPARVFLVQYEGQIDAAVIEQLQKFAQLRARESGEDIYFGIIDGKDSRRLRAAYPNAFNADS